MKITHYDALNVSRSAAPDVIEAAYRKLVQQHQAIGSLESQNRLYLGKYAYEILSKPEARIQYDKQISADHRSEPPRHVDLLGDNRDFGGASATWWRSPSSLGISVAIAVLIGVGYYFRGNSEQNSVAKSESIDALQRPGDALDIASTTKQSSGAINLNQNTAESRESSSNESAALSTNSPGLLIAPVAPVTVDDRNDSDQLTKSIPKASNLYGGEIGSENSGNKLVVGSTEPAKMQEAVRQQQETQRLQLQQQQMQLQAAQKQLELQRLQQEAVQRQLEARNEQQRRQQEDIHFQQQMQSLLQPQPPSQQIIGPQLQQQVIQQQVIQPQVQRPQVQFQPQTVQSQGAQTQQLLQAIQIQKDQLHQQRQNVRQDCFAALPSQASMSKAIKNAGTSSSAMAGLFAQRRAICDSMK